MGTEETTREVMAPIGLKARVLNAGTWTLAGFGSTLVLRLLSNLIIARLLSPEVFGIMAVCTAIHVIVTLIGDIGLKQAVIRSENGHDPVFLNTAWTVQILRGIQIWTFCIIAAIALYTSNNYGFLPKDSVYSNGSLPFLVVATSFSTVIQGLASMKSISLGRRLQLARITIIDVVTVIIGLSLTVSLAWATRSIWSFVISSLVSSLVGVTAGHLLLPGNRDRIAWDRAALRELMHFGKWSSISSFIGVIAMNGDRLLLGGWLTPTSLGQYSIASNLANVVDGIGSRVFGSVSLPALSEIVRNQPHRLREVFFRMRIGADVAYIGSAGFLFATAQTIVSWLYDPRYHAAGQMLQLLSFTLLFSRFGLAQDVYIALGKPSYLSAISFVKVISLFTVLPILFHFFGTLGAIFGMSFYLLPTLPLILWFNQKHRLNNFQLELLLLGAWPVGWFAGNIVTASLQSIGAHF